jgi:hypothetical protein
MGLNKTSLKPNSFQAFMLIDSIAVNKRMGV